MRCGVDYARCIQLPYAAPRLRTAGRCRYPVCMHPALERFITQFKPLSEALIDSWFIVDKDRTIVEFNRAFFTLLPRQVARGLKGKKCHDVMELEICKERCIAEQCWRDKKQVRLDEINGKPAQTEAPMRFVLSGLPIVDDDGNVVGALE